MPKKNDIFCFSEGCYSDYSLMGHFKALKDFSMKDESIRFLNTDLGNEDILEYWDRSSVPLRRPETPVKTGERPIKHSSDAFQSFLIREGLVEDLDVTEYHLGDYNYDGLEPLKYD